MRQKSQIVLSAASMYHELVEAIVKTVVAYKPYVYRTVLAANFLELGNEGKLVTKESQSNDKTTLAASQKKKSPPYHQSLHHAHYRLFIVPFHFNSYHVGPITSKAVKSYPESSISIISSVQYGSSCARDWPAKSSSSLELGSSSSSMRGSGGS